VSAEAGSGVAWVVLFAIVPLIALMLTSFVKLSVVLALLRNAIGAPDAPSALVVTGLSLILTGFVMTPVAIDMIRAAEPSGGLPAGPPRPAPSDAAPPPGTGAVVPGGGGDAARGEASRAAATGSAGRGPGPIADAIADGAQAGSSDRVGSAERGPGPIADAIAGGAQAGSSDRVGSAERGPGPIADATAGGAQPRSGDRVASREPAAGREAGGARGVRTAGTGIAAAGSGGPDAGSAPAGASADPARALDLEAALQRLVPAHHRGTLAAAQRAREPLRAFLSRHTAERDRETFVAAATAMGRSVAGDELWVLAPAFLTSELREAFAIAALVFVPFLVVDLVVGLGLAALGLAATSPQAIALPLKLMLFVAVDGWRLLVDALLRGYA
jgi:flagellar biosynthesis protein FliP